MSWLIKEINNATHEITLSHREGDNLFVTIPEEHRVSNDHKNAWIKDITRKRDIQRKKEQGLSYWQIATILEGILLAALIASRFI